ncbi:MULTISPECIES: hypothetical protein [Kitasatospora]|uniref:Lipoprotein n=2 Tax=Kitasatospora TaxID=2063 RepID=A0ABT1J834_9ACTN|nr:hypothetical protein [Kitasatospora paracochleata]MCP2313563.1 hypothetical protein [Kitasatospora paracochleata]
MDAETIVACGRSVTRAGRTAAVAALLALTTGCGGGSSGSTTAPQSTVGATPESLTTLFPGSGGGGSTPTSRKVPATPINTQSTDSLYFAAGQASGVTMGDVHLPPGSFSVVRNGCTGKTLTPGQSCVVVIEFAPKSVGSYTVELTVDTSAADADYRVRLTGVGVGSTPSSPPTTKPSPSVRTTHPTDVPSVEVTT